MKKLMIAAFAAASVCAFADIESTNIVGYQTTDTVAGFNFYIPQFNTIGSQKISIQDIKLTEGATEWGDNIQVLDEGGATLSLFVYASGDESGLGMDGWLTEGLDALADVEIDPGQSVLVSTEGEAKVTNAGEVSTAATEVTSVAGFNFVGNNSPVEINIQDIKLGGAITDWGDNIQILDAGGSTVALYVYATADESGLEEDGWLTEGLDALADITIRPGQGVLISTESAGVKITLPSAK